MSGVKLLLSDARGIYIPRDFFNNFDLDQFGLNREDYLELENPNNELYWDFWDKLLQLARHVDAQGNVWQLWQDGDLFAYCKELMTDNEKMELFGECYDY